MTFIQRRLAAALLFLIYIFSSAHAQYTAATECGRSYAHEAAVEREQFKRTRFVRIIGGIDSQRGAWPWMAAIRQNDWHRCGASIIDHCHLLTAAHCFGRTIDEMKFEIVAGDWDNRIEDGTEQRFTIDRVAIHPDYISTDLNLKDDIAIITIRPQNDSCMQYSKYVQPICLPAEDEEYTDGRKCIVSGWGRLGDKYHLPTRLQSATVKIISHTKCTTPEIFDSKEIDESQFCAGYINGGIGASFGDSGGPLACDQNDRFYVMGIVSWGDDDYYRPGIYTKVADYVGWIRQTIVG